MPTAGADRRAFQRGKPDTGEGSHEAHWLRLRRMPAASDCHVTGKPRKTGTPAGITKSYAAKRDFLSGDYRQKIIDACTGPQWELRRHFYYTAWILA